MNEMLVDQPIIVYPERSQSIGEMIRKGQEHPIRELEAKYPGKWAHKLQMLPFVMKIIVSQKSNLHLEPTHLRGIRRAVLEIVRDLPVSYYRFYWPIMKELKKCDASSMDIPRLIEYLTMVGVHYVFDCIERNVYEKPRRRLRLEGLTLPVELGTQPKDRILTAVWLFHNYKIVDIDLLLIECQLLAVEKIRAVLAGREMNLLSILKIKCQKFHPVPSRKREMYHRLSQLIKTMSRNVFSSNF